MPKENHVDLQAGRPGRFYLDPESGLRVPEKEWQARPPLPVPAAAPVADTASASTAVTRSSTSTKRQTGTDTTATTTAPETP